MDSSNTPPLITPPSEPARKIRLEKHQKWAKRLWAAYGIGTAVFVGFFALLSFQLPSFESLENPRSRIASEVYTADGEMIGKFYIENRSPVPYDSLSPHLVKAVIATEDSRFYEHSGIDPRALGRVAFKTVLMGDRGAGGGSTISQQLAKLLVGRPKTAGKWTPVRFWMLFTTKLKEWLTAVKLERAYTKEEIIALYFNEFDFLYGACGIKSASETYFGTTPAKLSIVESAMLVRMLQNPSLHNPKRHAEQALKGREQVLWLMKEAGHITEAQYHELRVKPIDISKFKLKDHNEGTATYFREYLREYAEEMLKKPMSNGRAYDIYRDGLKIYVTIDSRMQAHAEKAAWVHLSEHQKKLFSHWPNWNGKLDNPNSGNPWTYREDGVSEKDIALRKQILERLIFESARFQYSKDDLMPTFASLKMREIDLVRMRALSDAERKKRGQMDSLLNDWYKTGYVDETLKTKYENLVRSDTWVKVEEEYKGVLDLFAKPVKMKVFAYNKEGEKDTTMSPLDSIRYHRMHLQTGCMAMDPNTGYVKAWVGGINHKYFKYDHVNRKAKRQVGSSIKGFLYALAVDERGYSSCYKVADVSTTIEAGEARFGLTKSWTPKNAGGGSSGAVMTLTQALTKSLNTVSAKLMKDMGSTQPFRNFLGNIGIDTLRIAQSPTICLGAADISVFEMTGGYTMFANGGFHVEPIFIERIVDKNGYEIFSAENEQVKERVLSDEGAFVMNEMLQAVQRSAGGFTGIKSPHGGKTGTTNYQADGWYLGFTPSLVIGTWVGCDDRFIRFRNLGNGAGAKMARPIYQNFMRYVEADPNTGYNIAAKFPRPDIIQRETECGNFKNMNFGDEDSGDLPPTDVTNDTYIYDFD